MFFGDSSLLSTYLDRSAGIQTDVTVKGCFHVNKNIKK